MSDATGFWIGLGIAAAGFFIGLSIEGAAKVLAKEFRKAGNVEAAAQIVARELRKESERWNPKTPSQTTTTADKSAGP